MKVNEHNLLETLKKQNVTPKVQSETNQIHFTFKHEDREFPVFLRQLHQGELLQLLTFMPNQVDEDKTGAVARFLHMLNKELDMPGFCLDEQSRTVFYRLMLPSLKSEFSPEALEAFLNTSQVVCKSFATVIEALSIGAVTLDEILKKANQLQNTEK